MTVRSGNNSETGQKLAITEALLNEIKGNVFEFCVGRELARLFGREVDFLQDFGSAGMKWLSPYESYLRTHHPNMIGALAHLARESANKLFEVLGTQIPKQILVIGKQVSGSSARGRAESDLRLVYSDKVVGVSVKLCKSSGYVNTKSGGIKSFLEEYFDTFKSAGSRQQHLSAQVDHAFESLGSELYESQGLNWTGRFDEQWSLPHLPGQLPSDIRERVLATYSELASVISHVFWELSHEDPERFKKGVKRLLGHSEDNLIQLICFHSGERDHHYELQSLFLETDESIEEELRALKILPYKSGLASFEIALATQRLQIRVKPMNTFTTPSYKINCSVKHNC